MAPASTCHAVFFQNGLMLVEATVIFYARFSTADATMLCAGQQGFSFDNDPPLACVGRTLQCSPPCEWPSRYRRIVWRPGFNRENCPGTAVYASSVAACIVTNTVTCVSVTNCLHSLNDEHQGMRVSETKPQMHNTAFGPNHNHEFERVRHNA